MATQVRISFVSADELNDHNFFETSGFGGEPVLTLDEYYTAVLMEVGAPPKPGRARTRHRTLTYNAMLDLAHHGPDEVVTYAKFCTWCLKEKTRDSDSD